MLDAHSLNLLRSQVQRQTRADVRLLEQLRSEVRGLRENVRVIRPRSTAAVSVVAGDGGNNGLEFDPFYVHLVQVADSYGKVLDRCVLTPTTDTDELSHLQFGPDGRPQTPLGRLMIDLGVDPPLLSRLSPMIPSSDEVRENPLSVKGSWVQVYRDLSEWAALYDRICNQAFATDTLVIRDGLLRSKIFSGRLFAKMIDLMKQVIEATWEEERRRIFLVGIAKSSSVIDRYKLALDLENILPDGDPVYVPIPPQLEQKAYRWQEWAMGETGEGVAEEWQKFAAGRMHFVRFGPRRGDPLWAVDIPVFQLDRTAEIFGYLLADAREGFPVPYYPMALQRAHEHARIAAFEWQIFQDLIYDAVKECLPGDQREVVDAFRLQADVRGRRYR